METKHTPGPLDVKQYSFDLNCYKIMAIGVSSQAEADANARLFDAAPELLGELRGLLLCLEQHIRLGHIQSDPRIESARAAIAKATGKEV